MNSIERGVIAVAVAWLGAACGGGDVPARQLADTEASIRAAKEVGAERNPEAALQLKLAQDRLARADKLDRDGDHEEARAMLHEAELDAELAVLIARQEQSEGKALQAKQRAASLGSAKESEQQQVEQAPSEAPLPEAHH
jgi:hypothetical protein